eukprot:COSAG03_NODE_17469_length_375_cov_0.557971_1_plen_56_part_01
MHETTFAGFSGDVLRLQHMRERVPNVRLRASAIRVVEELDLLLARRGDLRVGLYVI